MTTSLPIELRHVSKAFRVDGRVVEALHDVSLSAGAQEFVTLIGPSGCGKSTLLNIIAGLMQPGAGEVLLHGKRDTNRLGETGYMPQRDLLLPWRTVLDNVILGPEVALCSQSIWAWNGHRRRALEEARREARALLPLFGLEGFEQSYPAALSGGMRQRAALMRTFMCKRDTILLDEPFGALDALTRRIMRRWLLEVWARFRQSVLFVTHDVDEAIYLSDRIYVLSSRPGRIVLELSVDLRRPRDGSQSDARFVQLREEILTALGV
ncbi:MAG: ABC transporter ATP-binding protein [Anaerolineae bacterium]|nr:ABC transporter ATP-binding protein [Anaerolineae bacterium]